MTARQFRWILHHLGLTQAEAARVLRVNGATARRWAAHGVTGTAEILIRLLAAGIVSVEDIRKLKKGPTP
jgi:hypothetical protein